MTRSPALPRRLVLGSSALTLAAVLAPGLEPAGRAPALGAAFAFFILLGARRSGARPEILAGLAGAALLIAILIPAAAAALGLIAGALVYLLAFSPHLDFLELPDPWSHALSEFRALFIHSSKTYWDETYASGRWDCLRSTDERPRHYMISGIVRDRFPTGAGVLDVGCGYGTLFPLLKPQSASYRGIDLAGAAVQECRKTFKDDPGCRFDACAFEDFQADAGFDVVVLNEVLYYFHFSAMDRAFRRALSLLKDEGSVLIVSLGSNPKAAWTRRRLAGLARPAASYLVTNDRGGAWTINIYQRGSACA